MTETALQAAEKAIQSARDAVGRCELACLKNPSERNKMALGSARADFEAAHTKRLAILRAGPPA